MSVSTAIRWRRRLRCRADGAPEPSGMRTGRAPRRGSGVTSSTPTSRDRRRAVVFFRRPDGRRGRVQLDHPGREGLACGALVAMRLRLILYYPQGDFRD
jgi:hypothetical protein